MSFKAQVIKTYNGFYYVLNDGNSGFYSETDLVSCRVRGRIKRKKGAVVTGDWVEYELLPDGTGVIESCLPRQSMLRRPAVANVDQVVIAMAALQPDLNELLLNRFLVLAEWSGIKDIVICINKIDLLELGQRDGYSPVAEELIAERAVALNNQFNSILSIYEQAGYKVLRVCAKENRGIEELRSLLKNKVTVFAGPSGVGKSSLLNAVDSKFQLTTGVISDKIKRGKHTTRAAQLLPLVSGGIVVDTPGFSAAELEDIGQQELANYFPEYLPYIGKCYYNTCTHSHEPDCAVKSAIQEGKIAQSRYDAYINILASLVDKQKY